METELIQIVKSLSRPIEPLPTGMRIDLHPVDSIETVLFDVYGTLLISGSGDVGTAAATDSAEALTQALLASGYKGNLERAGELGPEMMQAEIRLWHEKAKQNGFEYPEVDISKVWKNVIGHFQALEILKPDDDDGKILRLAVEYECLVNPAWPMPGARETITFLKKRGFKLGIVSNAQFYTPLTLQALLGQSVEELGFDPELCVWSYKKLRAKPDIKLFQGLEKSVDLSKALYVGNDMLNDIWTATQAGCQTILFAGDQRSLRRREQDSRCKKLIPTAVVDDLRQITEMV
ncbi:MAG: HAD family hydrolase [Kiritimatiellales bacterium]